MYKGPPNSSTRVQGEKQHAVWQEWSTNIVVSVLLSSLAGWITAAFVWLPTLHLLDDLAENGLLTGMSDVLSTVLTSTLQGLLVGFVTASTTFLCAEIMRRFIRSNHVRWLSLRKWLAVIGCFVGFSAMVLAIQPALKPNFRSIYHQTVLPIGWILGWITGVVILSVLSRFIAPSSARFIER